MKNKKIIPELYKHIKEIKKNEMTNMKLSKELLNEFTKKGLNTNIPYEIMEDIIDIENLTIIELIAFTTAMFNVLKYDILKPSLYFSDMELENYESYVIVEEEPLQILEIQNCLKISNKEYLFIRSLEDLAKYRRNKLIAYNKNIQRASTIVRLNNGIVITKATLNKKGVKALTERFLKQNILATNITLCILLKKGKTPLYEFKNYDGLTDNGVLKVQPVFDKESPHYAPLIITDGFHRYTAGCDAWEYQWNKIQKSLNGKLTVTFHFINEEEAKQYINDVFQRSDTAPDWTESLAKSDMNDVVNMLANKIEILKNNVGRTYVEMKGFNYITCYPILRRGLEICEIDLSDVLENEIITDEISEIINLIMNRILKKAYNNNIKEFKKSVLVKPNMFLGYIYLANVLRQKENNKADIIKISDKLILYKDSEELLKLKLEIKNTNIESIIKFFNNLMRREK